MARYFRNKEFACKHCGCLPEGGMDKDLVANLDAIRDFLGVPLIISSGYRCPTHNRNVGGVPNSQHVLGIAVDVLVPEGIAVDYLADVAEDFGMDGVGRYYGELFVHMDTRGYKARW